MHFEYNVKIEDELVEVLSSYFYKYFEKLSQKSTTFIEFQKFLIQVPFWSKNDIKRESDKIKNSNASIENMIFLTFTSYNQILCYDHGKIPNSELFLFKCLKDVSRLYYENKNNIRKSDILDVLRLSILSFIPIKNILDHCVSVSYCMDDMIESHEELDRYMNSLVHIPHEQIEEYYVSE